MVTSDVRLNGKDLELLGETLGMRYRTDGLPILHLDSDSNLRLGGDGEDGDFILKDGNGADRIHLDAHSHKQSDVEKLRVYLDGRGGNIRLGGDGADGDLVLEDEKQIDRVHLNSGSGGPTNDQRVRAFLDGKKGQSYVGGDGANGTAAVRSKNNEVWIQLCADGNDVDKNVRALIDGRRGTLRLGGNGANSEIVLKDHLNNDGVVIDGDGSRVTCNEIFLRSPNGTRFRVQVTNSGKLVTKSVSTHDDHFEPRG